MNGLEPGHFRHLMTARVQDREVIPTCFKAGRDGRASRPGDPDKEVDLAIKEYPETLARLTSTMYKSHLC